MSIKKLDLKTCNQIAAGEVIENPASIVKELLENALDAGARRLKVSLEKGGLEEITVIDDGSGIPSDELRLSLERHATSKIRTFHDLQNIETLGFRGEALPSIASISKLSLTTRYEKEESGNFIFLEGGEEQKFQEVGFPRGTKVTVRDVFYNTPARLKFLKGTSAEAARATRVVQLLALSRPDVSFTLQREGRIFLETPGDGNLLNVIVKIYGHDFARQLAPLSFEQGELALHGFLSDPYFLVHSRNYQHFFVNKRYVRNQMMRAILNQSFARLVTAQKYPVAFLFLSLSAPNLDVNVHPNKLEIRFQKEETISNFLEEALQNFFLSNYRIPVFHGGDLKDKRAPKSVKEQRQAYPSRETAAVNTRPGPLQQEILRQESGHEDEDEEQVRGTGPGPTATSSQVILGQLFGTYILLQQEQEFILVDQHAAHERIIWEKLNEEELGRKEAEPLTQERLPLPRKLPPGMAEELSNKMDLLREIGLKIEQFGHNTFIVRAVPLSLKDIFTTEMILDILEDDKILKLAAHKFKQETILRLSCHAAIKGNTELPHREMESLLKQLWRCQNPFFCPHGRPVMIKMQRSELEKRFKRRE